MNTLHTLPDIATNMLAAGSNHGTRLTEGNIAAYLGDMRGMQQAMALRHSVGANVTAARSGLYGVRSAHDAELAEDAAHASIEGVLKQ